MLMCGAEPCGGACPQGRLLPGYRLPPPDWVFLQLVPLGRWWLWRGESAVRGFRLSGSSVICCVTPGLGLPSRAGKVSLPCGPLVSVRGRNCWQEQVSSSLFPLLSTRGRLWGGEALGLE